VVAQSDRHRYELSLALGVSHVDLVRPDLEDPIEH
jgi:hypothetical protein